MPKKAFLGTVASTLIDGLRSLVRRPAGNQAGLDVLRSLAIILVISGHFRGEYAQLGMSPAWLKLPLFFFGWTGVDLFFVLSGFLIGGQLWREVARTGTIRIRAFLLRRGMRIWPLYFAMVAFVALALGRGGDPSRVLVDVLFLANYAKGIVSGAWSLSTEEQFYILVPMLLLASVRLLPARLRGLLPLSLLALLPLTRYLSMHALHIDYEQLYLPIHTHSDGLVMGLVIAWLASAYPSFMKPAPIRANFLVPLVLGVLGVAARMAERDVFAFTSLALIFGGAAIFLLRDRTPWLQRILAWNGFFVVSRLSYGMYLNHFEILPRLTPWLVRALQGVVPSATLVCAIAYGLTILASMAVAGVTFAVIEHPFLLWRDRILGAHPAPRPAKEAVTATAFA